MHLHLSISSLGALIAGLLILLSPKLFRLVVGVYLVLLGLVGLLGLGQMRIL